MDGLDLTIKRVLAQPDERRGERAHQRAQQPLGVDVGPARPGKAIAGAVAYAHKGETALAAAEIVEAHRLSPDGRYSSIARLKEVGYLGVPEVRTLFETIYLTGYRKAGVPEE